MTLLWSSLQQQVWQQLIEIKTRILNFDIKPAKPNCEFELERSKQALLAKDFISAKKILRKLLYRHPRNLEIILRLIALLDILANDVELLRLLKYAIKLYPNDPTINIHLGFLYKKIGNLRASAKYFTRMQEMLPEDEVIEHFLFALKQKNLQRASAGYVTSIFNSHAVDFEDKLLNRLEYKSHISLAKSLLPHIKGPLNKVLDLGCGTGLLGQELKKRFTITCLLGVDLSKNMLAICRQKDLYDHLYEQDLLQTLYAEEALDLIVASDVFTYLGDLEEVFAQTSRALVPGGFFGLTVECGWIGKYKLTVSGRYQHSLQYLQSLYKRYQFSKMYSQTIDLRKEYGNMVAGYLVLIQK